MKRKLLIQNYDKSSWEKLLYLLSFAIIYLSIFTRIVSFLYNRSLWLDEGFLASSIIQRNYLGLLLPLDYNQGAPIGYLWIVKTFVYIFGSSEYVLRLLSLLAGIGAVFMFYKVLKDVFNDQKPYVGTAFFASIPFLTYYSIEFKPYMFDGFITLVSLYIFHLALTRKLKFWLLMLYCSFVIWFSFPAIFTITSFCLMWLGYSLFKGQKANVMLSLSTGIITLLSFSIYYYLFYGNLTENQSLPYWDLMRFPFIPRNIEDMKLIRTMGRHYMRIFDKPAIMVVLLLSFASIFLVFNQKRKVFVLFAILEVMLLLIASSLGYYGILNRILLFIIPIHVLMLTLFITEINYKWRKLGLLLSMGFILLNLNTFKYLFPENVYRNNREINPVISFLSERNDDTPVYLYRSCIPQFEYKTGYRAGFYGILKKPFEQKGIIYGSPYYTYTFKKAYSWESITEPKKLVLNVDAIEVHPKVYLLMANCPSEHLQTLLEPLKLTGSITEILRIYDTPIYLYKRLSI